MRHLRRAGLLLLLAAAAWHAGHAAWIEAKARLAQHLVRAAWQRTRAGERDARPWPWADTHPVARLVVPGQRVELFVLAGASGRTMAFGPGHLDGTARPGEAGNAVLSGHRDTHFAFLRRLREGDAILVERPDGVVRRYAVSGARVVDRRETWVASGSFDDTRLTLVTCYPFDAIRPGGPLRYVVTARLADAVERRTSTAPSSIRSTSAAQGTGPPQQLDRAVHVLRELHVERDDADLRCGRLLGRRDARGAREDRSRRVGVVLRLGAARRGHERGDDTEARGPGLEVKTQDSRFIRPCPPSRAGPARDTGPPSARRGSASGRHEDR